MPDASKAVEERHRMWVREGKRRQKRMRIIAGLAILGFALCATGALAGVFLGNNDSPFFVLVGFGFVLLIAAIIVWFVARKAPKYNDVEPG